MHSENTYTMMRQKTFPLLPVKLNWKTVNIKTTEVSERTEEGSSRNQTEKSITNINLINSTRSHNKKI